MCVCVGGVGGGGGVPHPDWGDCRLWEVTSLTTTSWLGTLIEHLYLHLTMYRHVKYTYIYAYIYIHMYIHIYVHMYAYIYIHQDVCIHIHTYTYIYMHNMNYHLRMLCLSIFRFKKEWYIVGSSGTIPWPWWGKVGFWWICHLRG